MTKTQKILIAIGVGVGVAYVYNRYKKGKNTTGTKAKETSKPANADLQLPEDSAVSDMTREEKEEFILDNVVATPQEVSSGFEGVRFVWNPHVEKMYPVGTIQEGQQPTFGDIFNSAEGVTASAGANMSATAIAGAISSVSVAEKSLKDLSDQEIELLFRVVKKMKENPSIMSEEEAVKELNITNPNIMKVVKSLKKRLNDIKIMKTDSNWNAKWESRKEIRRKRRKEFSNKMGFEKDMFDKQVRKSCGLPPRLGKGNKAKYKKCVEGLANKMRSKIKSEVRAEVSSAPVSTKEMITRERQNSFAKQITNRNTGGIFAGKRWDGESNSHVENLVDKGLV